MDRPSLGSLLRLGLALCACACSSKSGPKQESAATAAPARVDAAPPPSLASAHAGTDGTSVDTSSHASPVASAEPQPPSVIGTGTIDGAALRKLHVERLKADRSPVTVLRGESALELGQRICEAVVPHKPKHTPILLKPNLCGFDGIKDTEKSKGDDGISGRITDPEFTRGVVRCLKARGHTRITIAEGCAVSHEYWQRVTRLSGYEAMAAEEHVPLVAFDDDGVYDKKGDRPGLPLKVSGLGSTRVPALLLPKLLAEHLNHGLFISLPKVKAHRFSVVSMAIKGMQGTVLLSGDRAAYKLKFKMHKELGEYLALRKKNKAEGRADPETAKQERDLYLASLHTFAQRMVDVLELSTPDVVLADGAPAMAGDGFQQLYPSAEKFAIGGTNPVFVDKVGSELLGLWNNARLGQELGGPRSSPLITIAAQRYKLDLSQVAVTGDGKDLLKTPRPVHYRSLSSFSIHSDGTLPYKPPPPAAAATDKPELHAAALGSRSIEVDGKIDPVWEAARAVTWNTDYAGKSTGIETRARFIWSPSALYALFELSGAGLFTDRSRPITVEREALYKEDCVEIFLTPDPAAPKRYYEIELGPFGHFFDLDVDLGKPDTAWSSGATIGTSQDAAANKAVIEVALRAPEIVKLSHAGARLPLGLYRVEGKGERKYLAWSPPRTAKPNFHVPEAFGVLALDP